MTRKFFLSMLKDFRKIDYIFMAVLCLIVLYNSIGSGIASIVVFGAVVIFHSKVTMPAAEAKIREFEEEAVGENDRIMKGLTMSSPVICCVADRDGTVYWRDNAFGDFFSDDTEFADLGKSFFADFFSDDGEVKKVKIKDRIFSVTSSEMENDVLNRIFYFGDITELEKLREHYDSEKDCLAVIDVDNYDELMANTPVDEQSAVAAEIARKLADWADSMEASLNRIRPDRYLMIFTEKYLKKQMEEKFPIIDSVHEIETQADFPTSLSIGVGHDAPDLTTLQRYAEDALDLAVGRGGDQAAVKKGNDTSFYGGALPTVEKRNKGRSRIIAHTLTQLMNGADRVMIMGHKRPDMDCFGAAVGIYALASRLDKPVDIVLGTVDEAIEIIYEEAVKTGRFRFADPAEARNLITKNTLLVVVDAHIPAITECPELIDMAERIVVIDHHRRSALGIEKATLTFMEVYASSASELVTELLQYSGSKDDYEKFEVEALLAGITVDSKSFKSNTGVRTFEAASWLRRAGADIAEVQNFFKMRLDFYKKKVNIIASAEIVGNGIAVAYTKDQDPTMQVLVSQAADELLDMKGVDAAFTAGYGKGQTMLSARSRGAVNVQTIMELLGGGGHQNMAATQLDCSPEEAIQKVVQLLREQNIIQ